MFHVLEVSASLEGPVFKNLHHACVIRLDKGWDSCSFKTLDEAREYVKKWLGQYSPDDYEFEIGQIYHYSDYGDGVVIVEGF